MRLPWPRRGKNPPDDDHVLGFPISSGPEYFKKARSRVRSLSEPTQAAIEKAQPYNRLKPGQWFEPLWFLAQLNDLDKHRSSHIAVTAATHDSLAIDAAPGTFTALWNTGPLIDGAPFLRVVLTEPNPNVKVDFKATAAVVLDLIDIPPISVYWTTKRIRSEVVLVCRYLSSFLPT
jgi:hypothetical protein